MDKQQHLWTPDEIAQAIPGRWLTPPRGGVNISGVCYYVSHIVAGDLVVATSPATWGKRYVETNDKLREMQKKGASAAIVDRIPKLLPPDFPVYLNQSKELPLNLLGIAARKRFQGKVICVTGSVGKSSTKTGIAHILSQQGLTQESRNNFNHSPGVPLSLAQTPANYDYGVYEFCVDTPNHTLPKALIAYPNVAVVTEIENDHHHFYPTLEAIVDQKSLLFRAMASDSVAVLNRDTPYFFRLATAAQNYQVARIISFGENPLADVRLIDCQCDADYSQVTASVMGHVIHYQLALPGKHNVRNSLGILAAACAVNANYEKAAADLITMNTLPNHCVRSKHPVLGGEFELLDDSFSANPASVRAAFEYMQLLQPQNGGRKIIILGDIKELGDNSAALHAGLADHFMRNGINKLLALGPMMKNLADALPQDRVSIHTEDQEELIAAIKTTIKPGDVVMVKGSCRSAESLEGILSSLRQL
jgi:UDP-N-acetylmuramoyl-tripeptide--D-alanyl-D-alanine ligase